VPGNSPVFIQVNKRKYVAFLSELLKEYIDNENVKRAISLYKGNRIAKVFGAPIFESDRKYK